MDFTDALAQVFNWFDERIKAEPGFINRERFPTWSSFRAFTKQSIWNAADLAEEERQRRHTIAALPSNRLIAPQTLTPEERDELNERIQNLPFPHSLVFAAYALHEEHLAEIAGAYGWSLEYVQELFAEALDMLRDEPDS
jgi:DNA-directed RNA polymerase specialized sigma24 family protein